MAKNGRDKKSRRATPRVGMPLSPEDEKLAQDRQAVRARLAKRDLSESARVRVVEQAKQLGVLSSNEEGAPIPMLLTCPSCGERHIDRGEFATRIHHTHACQHCGLCWRPAVVATVGVQFLPGFKDEEDHDS